MQEHIPKHFEAAIERNLDYWLAKIKHGSDAESLQILPAHGEIVQAARFGVSVSSTLLKTVALFERYYNLIERHRLESVWFPIINVLISSEMLTTYPDQLLHLRFRHAALRRIGHQYEYATKLLEQLRHEDISSALEGRVLLELSECARAHADLPLAEAYGQQALALFIELHDAKWEASALNDLGMIATEQNNFVAAEEYLARAYQFEQQHNDPSRLITVLINQGRLYEFEQDSWRALRCYFEAQEYVDEVGNTADVILVLINLGNVYNQIGEHQKAQESLQAATIRLQNRTDLYELRILAHLNLGVTAYKRQQFEQTIQHSLQSAELSSQLGKHAMHARALMNIASAYTKLNDKLNAVQYCRVAQQVLAQAPHTPWVEALKSELQADLLLLETGIDQYSADTIKK